MSGRPSLRAQVASLRSKTASLTNPRTERKLELYIIVDIFLGVVEVVVRWSHDL